MSPTEWTAILSVLVGGGLLKYIYEAVQGFLKRRRGLSSSESNTLHVASADASLTVVARARDELEADNLRLRADRAESDSRHVAERQRWEAREAQYIAQIDALETKVREILRELESLRHSRTA